MNRQTATLSAFGVLAVTASTVASHSTTHPELRPAVQAPSTPVQVGGGTDLFMRADRSRAQRGRDLLDQYFQDTVAAAPGARTARPAIDVVIATLPDPLDSHLDYEFDAELAAIRQAFETSGYVIDRFWLPWPLDREKTDLAARNNRIDTAEYRHDNPGVILFRDASGAKLRMLYVVGEVPTSGVHAHALHAALQDRDRILADSRLTPDTPRVLHIVGPVFTGSGASLARAIVQWRDDRVAASRGDSVSVISGSATGDVAHFFQPLAHVSYSATVHSEAVLERVQRNVLCGTLQIPMSQIARLRESSTAFGASVAVADTAKSLSKGDANAANKNICREPFLDIPFPANISSLRTEYARLPVAASDASASSASGAHISLNLQDPSRAMENPPVMSALTPAVLDVWLDQLSRTLFAHRIRAVGILATDTRDKLFLAEQLRRRRRDIILFTTENNVLLLRQEVNPFVRGMLVFGTYPIELDAQQWDTVGIGDRRIAFANDGSEGIFNATRLQLSRNPWLAEYGAPGLKGAPLFCEPGFTPVQMNLPDSVPPVWVLGIGRAGYFPLAACPTRNHSLLMPWRPLQADSARSGEPLEHSEVLTYPIIALGAIVLTLLLFRLHRNHYRFLTRKVPRMEPSRSMRKSDWELLLVQSNVYSVLRVWSALIIALGAGIALIHRLGDEEHAGVSVFLAAGLLLSLALGVTVIHLRFAFLAAMRFRVAARERAKGQGERREHAYQWLDLAGRVVMLVIAATYMVLIVRFLRELRGLRTTSPLREALFLQRAGELDGGFSAAMVLILTGTTFAAWCSWHLKRVAMLLTAPSLFESASVLDGSRGDWNVETRWGTFMRNTRRQLLVLAPDDEASVAFLVCLVLAVLLARIILPSFEALLFQRYYTSFTTTGNEKLYAPTFDFVARFGLIAALAGAAWALFRVARVWSALNRVLDEIGRSPRVTAFERLPRRIARLTRLNVLRPHAQKLVRSISTTQWGHLRALYARMTNDERAQLIDLARTLPAVCCPQQLTISAGRYLDDLMTGVGAGLAVWPTDLFVTRKAPQSIRSEETTAVRFLMDLTAHAQFDEPSEHERDAVAKRIESPDKEDAPRSTSGHFRRSFAGTPRLWICSAEDSAVQAVDYIQGVMQHLRYLTLYIVVSLVLVAELIWSYELNPASTFWLTVIFLIVAAMITLVSIAVQMNRNEVLSRVAGTTPGAVTWDLPFVTNIAVIALVPIITFLGAELPWLGGGMFSWATPLMKAFAGH